MAAMGVSRTVVREAVAALRAEGLVTTRQGSGAFVAADAQPRAVPHRSRRPELDRRCARGDGAARWRSRSRPRRWPPSASRRSSSPPSAGRLRAIEAAIDRGEGAVNEDFAFHRAIADASGNPRFAAAPGVPRPPRHSAPERARVAWHAGGAAPVSDAHPEGAPPHLRCHPRRPVRRRRARPCART